jgi:hypothetical protein
MAGVMKAMLGIALGLVVALIIMAVVFSPPSFHPNGKTVLYGATVCPDSIGARSEFHKGIQFEEKVKGTKVYGDSRDEPLIAFFEAHKADFSPCGCSDLGSEVPVYIESEDATGIATITAKSPDGTLLHVITYASEIQSNETRAIKK